MRPYLRIGIALLLIVALFLAGYFVIERGRIRAFEERIGRAVITTLQRESPEQFLVTGRLDVTARVQVTSTRVFLPGVLDFEIGSATATVRAPGRISYGFDVSSLTEEHIIIRDDGLVEVVLPELTIYAVDPDLSRLEIESSSGWFQPRDAERRLTQEAVNRLRDGLEAQGEAHLHDSIQPRVNTTRAIQALLEPVLRAAGVDDPKVRVVGMGEVPARPIG